MKVAFEPWSLGDALIAAYSVNRLQRVRGEDMVLCCASRHQDLIHSAFPDVKTHSVDLPYTTKEKQYWRNGLNHSLTRHDVIEVYSIRGDVRDYRASGFLYPKAKRFFSGWKAFFARRISVLDLPFRFGVMPTRSRYDAWSYLFNLPLERRGFQFNHPSFNESKPLQIGLHVGAQWGSKRYPMVLDLRDELELRGYGVKVVFGPGDPCPDKGAHFLMGKDLVQFIKNEIDLLITNDSGPMHLGFALNKPTVAVFGNTGIHEWCPPRVMPVGVDRFYRGYSPRYPYKTDFNGTPNGFYYRWLSPQEITDRIFENDYSQRRTVLSSVLSFKRVIEGIRS